MFFEWQIFFPIVPISSKYANFICAFCWPGKVGKVFLPGSSPGSRRKKCVYHSRSDG